MNEEMDERPRHVAAWEDEGGSLSPATEGCGAIYFRQRELHCRTRAEQCSRHGMRGTYLGFAARYAALAADLEARGADEPVPPRIV